MSLNYLDRGFWLPCLPAMLPWLRRHGIPTREIEDGRITYHDAPDVFEQRRIAKREVQRKHRAKVRAER